MPTPATPTSPSSVYRAIYRIVKRIPRGRVATYGQIARLAGFPNQPRLAGYALYNLKGAPEKSVPWHRVINARGKISLPPEDGGELQRALLEQEGVVFTARDTVDLARFLWKK